MTEEWIRDNFELSTDKARIDRDWVWKTISSSHWAEGISRKVIDKSIDNSLCFAMFDMSENGRQMATARVISDFATFAYLSDVFMEESYRGRGLCRWMVRTIRDFPELQGLRRFALVSTNARDLYSKCGFEAVAHPERWMEIYDADVYKT